MDEIAVGSQLVTYAESPRWNVFLGASARVFSGEVLAVCHMCKKKSSLRCAGATRRSHPIFEEKSGTALGFVLLLMMCFE